MQIEVDIAIIGAGPVGLCFAAALADSRFSETRGGEIVD